MRPWISAEHICRYHRFWHTGRVCIAIIFSMAIVYFTQLPHGQWMMVTIIVVMGPVSHVGGIKGRAQQRFMGTVLGALAGLVPMLFPEIPHLLFLAWIVIGVGLSCYYALGHHAYAALVVGLTLIIVTAGGQMDLESALWRTFNVLLGNVIALLCSNMFAHRADDHWRYLLAENLRDFAIFYKAQIADIPLSEGHTERFLQKIRKRLETQQNMLTPLKREHSFYSENSNGIISEQRRLLSTLEMIQKTRIFSERGHRCIVFLHQLHKQQMVIFTKMGLLHSQIQKYGRVSRACFEFDYLSLVKQLRSSAENDTVLSPFGYIWLNRNLMEQLTKLYHLLPKMDSADEEPVLLLKTLNDEDDEALGNAGIITD